MSIYPFFIHFPHFHILILVIGHMTTIPPLFCHAQPPLQNNVHPCSSVIPSMHTKSMLVLFFIRFSLLFPVHLSFFCPFPSFPYFDLGYWPHDNYPSPLLPCTTSPSKQCSSMFMYCSIHAHQKHVSFVFIRFSLLFHVHLSFFCPFPSFPYFDLRYWPHDNYPSPLLPCTTSPSKSMLVVFFIHFSLLFPVHLSFFYLFPSFPYFDLGYWPHDNYPSPLLPCTTSPSKQCSSMFMYCSIHAHQKHVSFVFIRFSLLFHVHLSFFCPFPSFPYFDLRYWPHDNYPSPLLPCTTSPSKQCSSMFMCYFIDAHQKHVSCVFHPFLPPISCPSILFLSISLISIF